MHGEFVPVIRGTVAERPFTMKWRDIFKKNELDPKGRAMVAKALTFIERNNLSTIPSMLGKIMELGHNPNASAAEYAGIYSLDQSSCMRLLILANSVYYGTRTGQAIRSVEEAIVRVGINRAREVVNSAVVAGLFKNNAVIGDYSTSNLWLNSVAVAVGNRALFAQMPPPVPLAIDPYMAGLLHNTGISIEHQCFFSEGFEQAVNDRVQNDSMLWEEEKKNLGITHNELGLEIARHWSFPEDLLAVIAHHHDLESGNPQQEYLLNATRVSEWFAFELGHGYSDFCARHQPLYDESRKRLGIDDERLSIIKDRMKIEVNMLKDLGWFSSVQLRRA